MLSYLPSALSAAGVQSSGKDFWIDLMQPTPEEIARVESEHAVRIPSAAQLKEIESSSRLRTDGTTMYLSMPLVAHGETADAAPGFVGFILSAELLITVRYSELPSFADVRARIEKDPKLFASDTTFTALIEAMVDFAADFLESIGASLGGISRRVFRDRGEQADHRRAFSAPATTGARRAAMILTPAALGWMPSLWLRAPRASTPASRSG